MSRHYSPHAMNKVQVERAWNEFIGNEWREHKRWSETRPPSQMEQSQPRSFSSCGFLDDAPPTKLGKPARYIPGGRLNAREFHRRSTTPTGDRITGSSSPSPSPSPAPAPAAPTRPLLLANSGGPQNRARSAACNRSAPAFADVFREQLGSTYQAAVIAKAITHDSAAAAAESGRRRRLAAGVRGGVGGGGGGAGGAGGGGGGGGRGETGRGHSAEYRQHHHAGSPSPHHQRQPSPHHHHHHHHHHSDNSSSSSHRHHHHSSSSASGRQSPAFKMRSLSSSRRSPERNTRASKLAWEESAEANGFATPEERTQLVAKVAKCRAHNGGFYQPNPSLFLKPGY